MGSLQPILMIAPFYIRLTIPNGRQNLDLDFSLEEDASANVMPHCFCFIRKSPVGQKATLSEPIHNVPTRIV